MAGDVGYSNLCPQLTPLHFGNNPPGPLDNTTLYPMLGMHDPRIPVSQ